MTQTRATVPASPPVQVQLPTVPRPRYVVETPVVEPPSSVEPSIVVDELALEGGVPARRHAVSWRAVVVDTCLALALAVATVALGALPLALAVPVAIAWPLVLLAAGHYRHRALDGSRAGRVRSVLRIGLRGAVLALAASPWLPAVDVVALAQLVVAVGLASAAHHLVSQRRHRPRLVLAGRLRDVREAMLELEAAGRHEVVAVCLTRPSKESVGEVASYVGIGRASDVAGRHGADALVVLPGARLAPVELRRLHWALAGVGTELCVGTGLFDVTPTRTHVFASGGLTLVRAVPPTLRGPRRWIKDVVERVAATAGLLLLLPVLLVVGLLVRLDSSGPTIYRQQRIGRDGRPFTMYKFRSMSTTADIERTHLVGSNEADGLLFKIQRDPRVTPLGGWLRRNSLDELPQLWNVVRGDMSLVGPRPALPDEVARYDADPRRRLAVKPGMTGLWQVSGRSDLSWAESVRLDVRYVDNWSFGLDLAILLRTIGAVLGHRGAY